MNSLDEDYKKLIKNIEELNILENQETDFLEDEKQVNLKKKLLEDFRSKKVNLRIELEELTSQDNFYRTRLLQLKAELEDWSLRKKRSAEQQDNILSRR